MDLKRNRDMDLPRTPMAPTINLNGTSGLTLVAELEEASAKLRSALNTLELITVHGRDFPNEGSYQKAMAEKMSRSIRLLEIQVEIESIWNQVQDQISASEERHGS